MVCRHAGGGKGLHKVVVHVAAKISRIIRVDGGRQSGIEQVLQIVAGQIGEHAEFEVGQRAHRQGNAVFGQTRHQQRVFAGLHAVVNALNFEHIKRRPDIRRRAFFTRVGHQSKPQFPAACEHPRKLFRRVAHLAGIQADANDLVLIRQRLLQRFKRLSLAQVAQKAHDQQGADPQLRFGVNTCPVQAVDDDAHADTARRVGLRVKKQFCMNHMVCSRLDKVGMRHVVEVLACQQHTGACVINVQKALQVGEGVGPAQFVNAGVRKRHAIALGQCENQLRLQRTFNVHVQLGFGHAAQQLGQAFSCNGFDQIHPNSNKLKSCPQAAERQHHRASWCLALCLQRL